MKLFKWLCNIFANRDFLTFIIIGIINAFNGVLFALLYSMVISNAVVSYIVGFFTSLIIAYILNTIFNFKQKLSFINFEKYVINNIPNFIIQISTVFIVIEYTDITKLYAYVLASVISVPLTFALIKINVFNK